MSTPRRAQHSKESAYFFGRPSTTWQIGLNARPSAPRRSVRTRNVDV